MIFFLIGYLLFVATIIGLFVTAINFDRIVVIILDHVDLPIFPDAYALAALIYRHPEQWDARGTWLKHPEVGEIKGSSASGLYLNGTFGDWWPNFIERRIIWNAVVWWQRTQVRAAVRKQLG